ncbi:MAG: inner membrane protein [Gammaproteobacteria bacterium]
MDSLTQVVLGAAVAEAAIGRTVGRRAAVYGAALGTLPDLDVFVSFGGVIEDFVYHRGVSHSLLVLTLLSPLLAWLIHRRHAAPHASYRHWLLAVWLVLITHPLLDVFTIYGTQLWWPLTDYPYGVGSVFIIDPLFTVPMALGLLAALLMNRRRRLGGVMNATGMFFGAGYLAFGLSAQAHVHSFARDSLQQQGVVYEHLQVLAAPFTSMAWRVVVVGDDEYFVAYHSLLAPAGQLRLTRYEREPKLLNALADETSVRHLRRFTKGMFTVSGQSSQITVSDLRMGLEPNRYAFTFVVGAKRGDAVAAVPVRRIQPARIRDGDWSRLISMLRGAPNL